MTTILERCRQRFSVRKFTDEPVSNEELNYILEAARLAPSAVNRQLGSSSLSLPTMARPCCGRAMTESGSSPPHCI